MKDHRQALEDILRLCSQARIYTRRTQNIHEAAMKGLGLTANQRNERHIAILERNGVNPFEKSYRDRVARRAQPQNNELDEYDNPLDGQMGG